MKLRTQILLFAVLNLVLLAAALLVFVRVQFASGVQSLLLAPGQTRLRELGDDIADEVRRAPVAQWNAILDRHARATGIQLGLVENNGPLVAGTFDSIPEEVWERLRPPPDPERPPPPPPRDDQKRDKGDFDKGRYGKEKADRFGKDKKGKGPPDLDDRDPQRSRAREVFLVETAGQYWFGVRLPLQTPDDERPVPGTLLVRSSSIFTTPFLFDPKPWVIWSLAVAAIALACWIPFIRGLTTSVRKLTDGAERIAEGRFDVALPADRSDEIGHLGGALNRMAAQLSGFVHGQKRFLGDVAHELSAPLARTQVALGILEDRADDKQRKYVTTVREEVEHITSLVNELLHFSKAGLQSARGERVPVRIGEVVKRVIDREAQGDGDVHLTQGGELKVLAQPEGLFRALSNLVRNALIHAGTGGPIVISAQREKDYVTISVADNGPGLPEDSLDRVFTPFYRPDASRSRDSGGVGLGLAIVKTCVESSGGTVVCRNRTPKGLEVIVRLEPAS